ncbi:MAG: outer membrane protein assembly factor BamA [bacterium]
MKILFLLVGFHIFSGAGFAQEVLTEKLEFKGNKSISDGKMKKVILTDSPSWYQKLPFLGKKHPFDHETFLNDLLRIEKYYYQQGYLEARVSKFDLNYNQPRDKVRIVIHIEEGERTKVHSVEFESVDQTELPIAKEKLRKMLKLKKGKPYREEELRLDYHKLIEQHSERGYPYIQAKVKPRVDRQRHKVDLIWYLDTGPASRFGKIQIKGVESVSKSVILRGLGFKTGQPFIQSKLASAQSQVYRLELFQFVSLRTVKLDQKPAEVPIEIRVKESMLRTLKFGAGYGTEESFRATAQWRHRNFLGGGRIFRMLAKHSTNLLPVQLEMELSQPYFLSNRNDLIVKPFFVWQDEKSFEVKRIGFETTFNRQLSRRTNFFVTNRLERDTVEVKITDTEISKKLADLFNKSILRVGLSRNSTDQIFSPTHGSISRLVVEEAGRFLRTPFKYLKTSFEYRQFVPVKPGFVFALRVFVGSMKAIRGSEVTPVEERFFSGGSYSVRGWRRQLLGPLRLSATSDTTKKVIPEGGNSILEGNLELRNPIYKNLTGAVFLDFGNVWKQFDGFDVFDLRYALGAGLRYNTFIGALRLDFAWKLNRQPLDERNYEFHVSLGHAF